MKKKKFSQKKYIMTKGRTLPIEECLISDGYENSGLTVCLIVRKQPSGYYTFANFVVDRFCLGIKDAMSSCNVDDLKLQELKDNLAHSGPVESVSPEYFHNMIYAAKDYAEDLGFSPHKDFILAEYLLEDSYITNGIDEIEMGKNGRPFYIQGPFDNVKRVIATLTKSVGVDGFEHIEMQNNTNFM